MPPTYNQIVNVVEISNPVHYIVVLSESPESLWEHYSQVLGVTFASAEDENVPNGLTSSSLFVSKHFSSLMINIISKSLLAWDSFIGFLNHRIIFLIFPRHLAHNSQIQSQQFRSLKYITYIQRPP